MKVVFMKETQYCALMVCFGVLLLSCFMIMRILTDTEFEQALFEDIKKIVDQMWETLNENLKKVSDVD